MGRRGKRRQAERRGLERKDQENWMKQMDERVVMRIEGKRRREGGRDGDNEKRGK